METGRRLDVSRRDLLKQAVGTSAAVLLPATPLTQAGQAGVPRSVPFDLNLPVLAEPVAVLAFVGDGDGSRVELQRSAGTWIGGGRAAGVLVDFGAEQRQAVVSLESPAVPVQRVHLRWRYPFAAATRVLGDAWERSYGDLEWLPLQAERVLPWYAMVACRERHAGMGVKTGAACFAFWQVDAAGVSLWLDVRNGSNGVRPGQRRAKLATIVTEAGEREESAFSTTKRLCRRMAEGTVVPARRGTMAVRAIYGSNDWYYAYGNNTPAGILRDAELVGSLAPAGGSKPFTVIDDGYQDRARFPDLAKLALGIRGHGAIPGLWIRPLRAPATTPERLLLPHARWQGRGDETPPFAYDPTVPEAMEAIAAVATEACGWGFDLIKHDFTTYELFGRWGSQMGASPAGGDWHFADRSVTNAEIVTALYQRIRSSCGEDRMILGCNTVGHLSVGLFDASRTGDDVSGRDWERTRRMGVNTLAFRLPQHRAFFAVDADCVPVTRDVAWPKTRQWLRAVADSGTVLLISPEPGTVGKEQQDALREAFERCVQATESEPLDWLDSRTPAAWRSGGETQAYDWIAAEGQSPFPIGIQRGPA